MTHSNHNLPTILLLAPYGQVGFELRRSLAPLGHLIALSREQLDLTDLEQVKNYLDRCKATVVVNAAAYTAVDKAETDTKVAEILNHQLPKILADYVQREDGWLIHYSSDYVYPGDGTKPWIESDDTQPLSVYGQSKLDGDNAVINGCDKHLIFRTSWVYAARRHNFMKTMLKLAQSRSDLKVVNDQIGAPTPARLIGSVTALALHKVLTLDDRDDEAKQTMLSGVYHLAPRGETSWYDFARYIFDYAKKQGVTLMLEDEQFVGISTSEYPTPAIRPANSRLSVEKIEQIFALQMPNWQTQLELTLDEYLMYHQ